MSRYKSTNSSTPPELDVYYSQEQIAQEEFVARLTDVMEREGMPTPALAAKSGVNESTIKNILYKGTDPKRSTLIDLANALNTTVEYLATGSSASSSSTDSVVSVPVFTPESLAFSMGLINEGLLQGKTHAQLPPQPIKKDLLNQFSLDPADCKLLMINNDTMSPELNTGQLAIIDTSPHHLSEAIFVMLFRNTPIIRRAVPVSSGFALTASNPKIAGSHVEVDEYNNPINKDIKIVAKVLAAIRVWTF